MSKLKIENMGKTTVWKQDGDQDKFIIKLIKQGKIHKDTKPAFLKANHSAVFGDFNLNVIRNHLNALKRSNGLYCKSTSYCVCHPCA